MAEKMTPKVMIEALYAAARYFRLRAKPIHADDCLQSAQLMESLEHAARRLKGKR